MNTRFHDVSQMHLGLMGFKDRADEAQHKLTAAEEEIAELKRKLEVEKVEDLLKDLQIHKEIFNSEKAANAANQKRATELQSEGEELRKKLSEAEDSAGKARKEVSDKDTAMKLAMKDADNQLAELKRVRRCSPST